MNAPTVPSAADRVVWLVPAAALAGAVLGPLTYLLFDAEGAPPEVVAGITGFGSVLGFTVGLLCGALAAAPAWLLLRARRPVPWAALAAGAAAAAPPALLAALDGAGGQAREAQDALVLTVAAMGAAGFVALTQARPARHRTADPAGLDLSTAAR
ncbi:hypothetical protein NCCP1664_05430 [Zafaria cholistanensis]|uniref:Uncharacterized protein n=1 Tax=Zafaria cholistanensis TaxID=1682741 RepID=A0A5A7NNE6_9MICC|nr:hypothetical protein [Zafaria cholistanensis]GER22046.1 hypothetical protein NCCP1664_05430 [Zafaria cholistanensis]